MLQSIDRIGFSVGSWLNITGMANFGYFAIPVLPAYSSVRIVYSLLPLIFNLFRKAEEVLNLQNLSIIQYSFPGKSAEHLMLI